MTVPDRRRVRRIASLVLGVLSLLVLLSVLAFPSWIRSVEERRWAAIGRQIDDLDARLRRDTNRKRVLLRGTPVPGNAWDDYGPLLESLRGLKDWGKVHDFGDGVSGGNPAEVQVLIAPFASAPQALRRAASKAEYLPAPEPPRTSRRILKAGKFLGLVLVQVRFLHEAGRPREATELLLDAAQFDLDVMSGGDLLVFIVGLSRMRAILEGLARVSESLPTDDQRDLSRVLDIVDRSLPSYGDSLLADAAETGRDIQAAGSVERYLDQREIKERQYSLFWYANSERLVLVDYFDIGLQWAEETMTTLDKPWMEARELQTRLYRRMSRTRNPVHKIVFSISKTLSQPDSFEPHDPVRDCRARIRLVCAALGYRLTGEVPSLNDPFGTQIRWARSDEGITLWSVGRDGVDNGGVGDWVGKKGQDIVLKTK